MGVSDGLPGIACSARPVNEARRMMFLLGQRVALDRAADLALAHDEHAVAEADQLRQLGETTTMPTPFARQVAQDAVDLGLGADIDAAGRLVEEDDRAD